MITNVESVWNQCFFLLTTLPLKEYGLYTGFNVDNYGYPLSGNRNVHIFA